MGVPMLGRTLDDTALVRLGQGPMGPRTPRRPWDQVLTIEP
ncbi:hypothetical protein ACFWNT_15775 [Streptomyces sp. NPDC058409]